MQTLETCWTNLEIRQLHSFQILNHSYLNKFKLSADKFYFISILQPLSEPSSFQTKSDFFLSKFWSQTIQSMKKSPLKSQFSYFLLISLLSLLPPPLSIFLSIYLFFPRLLSLYFLSIFLLPSRLLFRNLSLLLPLPYFTLWMVIVKHRLHLIVLHFINMA